MTEPPGFTRYAVRHGSVELAFGDPGPASPPRRTGGGDGHVRPPFSLRDEEALTESGRRLRAAPGEVPGGAR